jgi:hypothetical protein
MSRKKPTTGNKPIASMTLYRELLDAAAHELIRCAALLKLHGQSMVGLVNSTQISEQEYETEMENETNHMLATAEVVVDRLQRLKRLRTLIEEFRDDL